VVPPKQVTEPGYASVLTGTLLASTTLRAEALPHLIRGILVVPAKLTLKIEAGAIVHLRSDAGAAKPLQAGAPDPTKSAAVWIYGTLLIAGENGRPVEIAGQDKDNANLLLYGAEQASSKPRASKALTWRKTAAPVSGRIASSTIRNTTRWRPVQASSRTAVTENAAEFSRPTTKAPGR